MSGGSWWQRLLGGFTQASYPFPPGGQNRDNVERNLDNPLRGSGRGDTLYLTLSTYFACVRLLSGTIASLPLNVFDRPTGSDLPKIANDYPLQSLLHDQPNIDTTSVSLIESLVMSLVMNGECYGEKVYGTKGRIVSINFLPYARVTWTLINGERVWRYTPPNGQQRVIDSADLWRTVGMSFDGICGVSVAQYGARSFASALSADVSALSTFEKGLMPTVGFKMAQILQKKQRKEFKEDFFAEVGGAINAGRPFLLEGGMEAVQIGINPADAQLLQSRAWSVEDICRWFGVSPVMIGHSERSTTWGTGLEQMNLAFLQYCLQPLITKLEASMRKDLLPVADRSRYQIKFSLQALLRADSVGRAALYSSAAQNGWMTRAEIRELEDLPHIPGSDSLTAQSNLLPLDKLGAQSTPAPALADALKNFLGLIDGQGTEKPERRV